MSATGHTRHRVVVTGLGAVSCLGNTAAATWSAMKAGRSGIRRIRSFDPEPYPIKIAGEVKEFDAVATLGATWAGRGFEYCQFAISAALEALRNAGIDPDETDCTDFGVCIANAHGVHGTIFEAAMEARRTYGLDDDDSITHIWDVIRTYHTPPFERSVFEPLMMLLMGNEAATDIVAERIGSQGPRFTISTACVSGARSVDRALRWLRRGQCDVVVAGGAESVVEPFGIWTLNAMKALSAIEEDPEGASRPFDINRSGFVLAQGSGILILETLEHAKKRGAEIYAEVVGSGGSANAFSLFAPEEAGAGPSGSMNNAIDDAGIDYHEVDAVFAHATATGVGDPAEAEGIRMTFKDHASDLAITAPKSMMGHAIGAAGALGAVACVQSIMDNVVPPTINLTDPDPSIAGLHVVRDVAEERPVNCALNNAFGFGGANGSNVFRRFSD